MHIHKQDIGRGAIAVLALINGALWLLVPPANDGAVASYPQQLLSELLATTAMILMASALVLATRLRVLEPYFGGLDKMYRAHRTTALLAVALLLGHALTVTHVVGATHLGRQLGSLALLGFLALAAWSVAPRLLPALAVAYERWRLVHTLNGLLFGVSLVHALLANPLATHAPLVLWYVLSVSLIGAAAYLYQTVLARVLRTAHPYLVTGVRRLNASVLEITLAPQHRPLAFAAGQFLYVRFAGDGPLAEAHPFTVSSAPGAHTLRLAVKASGDYTRHLYAHLQEGMRATVEGGYGRFTYTTGGPRQVWIAGGIGITPFLSWMGALEREVDVVYVVRTPAEALYLEEIAAAQQRAGFRAHVWYTHASGEVAADGDPGPIARHSGRPHAAAIAAACGDTITDRDIYLCGPVGLISGLMAQFRRLGVPSSQLHAEEFTFR